MLLLQVAIQLFIQLPLLTIIHLRILPLLAQSNYHQKFISPLWFQNIINPYLNLWAFIIFEFLKCYLSFVSTRLQFLLFWIYFFIISLLKTSHSNQDFQKYPLRPFSFPCSFVPPTIFVHPLQAA